MTDPNGQGFFGGGVLGLLIAAGVICVVYPKLAPVVVVAAGLWLMGAVLFRG